MLLIGLLLSLGIVVLANVGLSQPTARLLTYLLLGFGFGAQVVIAAVSVVPGPGPSAVKLAVGAVIGGVIGLILLWPQARVAVARFMPIDPAHPVHTLALTITADAVILLLAQQLSSDVLAQVASDSPLTPLDILVQEVPFLAAAALGVGLLTRREPREVAVRLGWLRPAWWQLALGVGCAGAFIVFGAGVDILAQHLTPGLTNRVNTATGRLFGGLQNPFGVATLALVPAICEEGLFRGALQPRLGLAWTAIVFTAVHTQYGLTFDTAVVLVLAVGLGLIRKYTNTTTSTVCHATYNGVQGALALAPYAVFGGYLALLLVLLLAAGLFRGRPNMASAP